MRLFEHRLIDEERELATRVENLLKFRCSGPFFNLPQEMQDLLHEQALAMHSYLSVLRRRIALIEAKQ